MTHHQPHRRRPWAADRERGDVNIETVVLAVPLILMLAFLIFAGRWTVAHNAVADAARDAARAASIARDATTAATAARAQALQSLASQTHCAHTAATIDASDFRKPAGQPGSVRATVSCAITLSDLGIPALGGTTTLTANWTSPIDRYQQRTTSGGGS